MVSYTLANGEKRVMAVWLRDYDAELFLTHDRDIMYSVYDGSSWSAPSILAANISCKENIAISQTDGYVAIAYNANTLRAVQPAPYNISEGERYQGTDFFVDTTVTTAYIRTFDISTGVWDDEHILLTKYTEFEQLEINNKMITLSAHGSYFVVSWSANGTIVYKTFKPTEPYNNLVKLTESGTNTNSISLSHTSDFTILSWTVTETSAFGYYYAIMESDSTQFGFPVFVEKPASNPKRLDTYAKTTLVSLPGEADPYFLRMYTERDIKEDPLNNKTSFGTARLRYDLARLGAVIEPVSAEIDINNNFTTTIVVQNNGVVTLPQDKQAVRVFTGNNLGRSNATRELAYQSLPQLFSGASVTISCHAHPDSNFEGYIWVETINIDSNEVLTSKRTTLFAPVIRAISVSASTISSGNVKVSVTVANLFPYQSGAVTIPITVLGMLNYKLTQFQTTTATIGWKELTVVPLEVTSSLLASDLIVRAGDGSTDFQTVISPNVVQTSQMTYSLPPPNLLLTDPELVEVLDPFVGTLTLRVTVQNLSPVPMRDVPLGVFLKSADFLAQNDPAMDKSIAMTQIPYFPGMAKLPLLLSIPWTFAYTGSITTMIFVNPYQTLAEINYQDNVLFKEIDVYPRYKLALSSSSMALNEAEGTFSFYLLNHGDAVSEVNVSVFHQPLPDTASYELLGQVTFTNITAQGCQLGELSGLQQFFTSFDYSYLSRFMLEIPEYFSGSTTPSYFTVESSEASTRELSPICNITLNSSPTVVPIQNITVRLGDELSVPIGATAVDSQFTLLYDTTSVPAFATFDVVDTLSARFQFAPTNSHLTAVPASGVVTYSAGVGLVDGGIMYSEASFLVSVVCPYVDNIDSADLITTTEGGKVTIYGKNFGKNTADLRVNFGTYACTNITLVQDETVISCNVQPGTGSDVPLSLFVRNGKNVDSSNVAITFGKQPN